MWADPESDPTLKSSQWYSGGSRIDERGFRWRGKILAMVVLTRENGAVAREARH